MNRAEGFGLAGVCPEPGRLWLWPGPRPVLPAPSDSSTTPASSSAAPLPHVPPASSPISSPTSSPASPLDPRRRALADLWGRHPAGVPVEPVRELVLLEGQTAQDLPALMTRLRRAYRPALLRVEWDLTGAGAERLEDALAAGLGRVAGLWLGAWVWGGTALTGGVGRALGALGQSPLAAHGQILLGPNDSPGGLEELAVGLLNLGVRPTHLVEGRWPGMAPLPPGAALALAKSLRGKVSGLAQPRLVVEDPQGLRQALVPGYVARLEGGSVEVKNWQGETFRWHDPAVGGGVAAQRSSSSSLSDDPNTPSSSTSKSSSRSSSPSESSSSSSSNSPSS
ncbi:MAG: hypothetical protein OEV94_12190 [Deltaproteobacteria bacterium]|nr:hypothetical protein [Deltaproteobacteria bacterium]